MGLCLALAGYFTKTFGLALQLYTKIEDDLANCHLLIIVGVLYMIIAYCVASVASLMNMFTNGVIKVIHRNIQFNSIAVARTIP